MTSTSIKFGPPDDVFIIDSKDKLGEGAQGTVLQCLRHRTKRRYAVKVINVEQLEKQLHAGNVRKNLLNEVRIMRELTHPRIVNLLVAFWQGDRICYVVMDLATGGSLHEKLEPDKGLGSERACKRIVYQLVDAMGYMHKQGVIHRDLKPDNILITAQDPPHFYDVKIADFGLSKALNAPGGVDVKHSLVGTPAFVAPEVLTAKYDEKADYFSLGCLLFAALCGAYPFDADRPAHFDKSQPVKIKPGKTWFTISESARSIVEGLLKQEPVKRFGDHECLRHKFLEDVDLTPIVGTKSQGTRKLSNNKENDNSAQCCAGFRGCFMRSARPRQRPRAGTEDCTVETDNQIVGVVQKISGWTGFAVDSIELKLLNGTVDRNGGNGGTTHTQVSLDADELLIAVTHEVRITSAEGSGDCDTTSETDYLGNAVVFFTSKGRLFTFKGVTVPRKGRFVAPAGSQIVGLQFDSSRLTGIQIQDAPTRRARGAVARISGWEGYAVDSVEFHLRNGSTRFYGDDGGNERREWPLEDDEYLVIVEQGRRDSFLGYSLAFYTSKGKVFQLQGMSASRSLRFIAPSGRQICGLAFKEGKLDTIRSCPVDGSMKAISSHQPFTYQRSFADAG